MAPWSGNPALAAGAALGLSELRRIAPRIALGPAGLTLEGHAPESDVALR